VGDWPVTLELDDSGGNGTEQNFTIHVAPNRVPTFTTTGPTNAHSGTMFTYQITTGDADGDTRTITALDLPAWLTLTDNGNGTATLSGTPSDADVGPNQILLRVNDGLAVGSQDFNLSVTPSNYAPTFDTMPPPAQVNQGDTWTYNIAFSDADGDPLTISAVNAPDWLKLVDHQDGTAHLSGAPGVGDAGEIEVTLQLSDGKVTMTQSVAIIVSAPNVWVNSAGTLYVNGNADDNSIHVWARNGNSVRVDRDGVIKDFALSSIHSVEVYGLDGNDNILLNTGSIPCYALGGAGNDVMTGGDEYDNFVGGGGKDALTGGRGNDRLNGGNANDTLAGNDGDDRLYGGDGNDLLVGGAGRDRCWGEAGDDFFSSRDRKIDNLYGGGGDDRATYDDLIDHLTDVLPA
jgi:Ca2+-binding RTX toxin-like protein